MALPHEHVGSKILAKIKIYILARAELLFNLCYEIPCTIKFPNFSLYHDYNQFQGHFFLINVGQ
jgi:hypothetical protein